MKKIESRKGLTLLAFLVTISLLASMYVGTLVMLDWRSKKKELATKLGAIEETLYAEKGYKIYRFARPQDTYNQPLHFALVKGGKILEIDGQKVFEPQPDIPSSK